MYREWDTECVPQLTGQFAFGLYDERCRRLLLARDRAGEKLLFYGLLGDRLIFASELTGLMIDRSLPRRLDPVSFDHFLAYGYVPGDRSILRDVRKRPQGHAATFDLGSRAWRVWPYWHLPADAAPADADANELVDDLESLLEASVRRQLVADVPLGILLSGGVDSNLVTALAARLSTSAVRTFTGLRLEHDRGCHD